MVSLVPAACDLRGGKTKVFAESVEVLSSGHLVDELFFGNLARFMLANDAAAGIRLNAVTRAVVHRGAQERNLTITSSTGAPGRA